MLRFAFTIGIFLLSGIGVFLYLQLNAEKPNSNSRFRISTDHEPFAFEFEHNRSVSEFSVDWPPVEPNSKRRTPPLLVGELFVSAGRQAEKSLLNFRIELVRADSERDRKRWNHQLKFPEYDWMSRVRVWDPDQQWLWPNLPFLLRAHGVERHQRYGGIDPGKGVDNDFAAIVVKSLSDGDQKPLIAAEWNSPPVGFVDKRSIVHRAISDDIQCIIPSSQRRGEIGVWLIYADFLDFSPPDSWPKEPEFDGGILSYFSVKWVMNDAGEIEIGELANQIPTQSTGVDWQAWLTNNQVGG